MCQNTFAAGAPLRSPDPTEGAYSAPPDTPAGYGKGGKGRGGERVDLPNKHPDYGPTQRAFYFTRESGSTLGGLSEYYTNNFTLFLMLLVKNYNDALEFVNAIDTTVLTSFSQSH